MDQDKKQKGKDKSENKAKGKRKRDKGESHLSNFPGGNFTIIDPNMFLSSILSFTNLTIPELSGYNSSRIRNQ